MKRLLTIMVLLITATACQVLGGDNAGGGSDQTATIEWDRNPSTVVFRAEVTGGEFEDAVFARNEIPNCTIYGDNRIVWMVNLGVDNTQVLIDRLSDDQIRSFVSALTVEQRIFTYDSQADLQPPGQASPVVEKISLSINGVTHVADSFSNWPTGYFNDVVDLCYSVPNAPVEFVPNAAWVSAEETTYNSSIPAILWDDTAASLSFAELAASGERRWISGNLVPIVWQLIRKQGVDAQFSEGDGTFHVAVEVPGISPDAPPAPGS